MNYPTKSKTKGIGYTRCWQSVRVGLFVRSAATVFCEGLASVA